MRRIVGIDPGFQNTGVCGFRGITATPFSVKTTPKMGSDYQRIGFVVRSIAKVLEEGDVVVFEDFGDGGRFQPSGKFVERVEMTGMMKYIYPKITKLPFILVRPSHLKSFIAGKSDSHKDVVKNAVEHRWGYPTANFDEADATALAIIGAALVNGNQDLKGRHVVVKKIREWKQNKAAFHVIGFDN